MKRVKIKHEDRSREVLTPITPSESPEIVSSDEEVQGNAREAEEKDDEEDQSWGHWPGMSVKPQPTGMYVKPQPKFEPKRVAASPGTLSPGIRNITVNVYSCGFKQKGVWRGEGQSFDTFLPELKQCLSVTDPHVQIHSDMWVDCRQFFRGPEDRSNHVGSHNRELELFTSHAKFFSWLAKVKNNYEKFCAENKGATKTFSIMCWVFESLGFIFMVVVDRRQGPDTTSTYVFPNSFSLRVLIGLNRNIAGCPQSACGIGTTLGLF